MRRDDPAERRLTAVSDTSSIQLEIANAIVRAHKELFGRGPTRARASVHGSTVVCVMGDCLTTVERTLVQNGRHESVAQLRNEMHDVARPTLMRIVERLTGRRVAACVSGIDLEADEQVATFRLDGALLRGGDGDSPAS
jgi:uncharacterized protein YbcI